MARLVIFDDRVRGLELPARPVLIGRSQKNDIPIKDGLLSRKHCSIVPVGGGYRLLDLKSSNGTYLNGKRIDKVDLVVDDIIEIGRTVMVFLEDGVWSRGEGLARLRNPLKAQELIGRIKLHHRRAGGGSRIPLAALGPRAATTGGEPSRPARRSRRSSRRAASVLDAAGFPDLAEGLEEFILQRALLVLTRGSPDLREIVGEVLAEALRPSRGAPGAASLAELRARIRAGLKARLQGREKPRAPAGKPEGRSTGAEGVGSAGGH